MGTTTVFDGNNGGAIFVDRYASDAEGNATPTYRYNEELSGQHPNRRRRVLAKYLLLRRTASLCCPSPRESAFAFVVANPKI